MDFVKSMGADEVVAPFIVVFLLLLVGGILLKLILPKGKKPPMKKEQSQSSTTSIGGKTNFPAGTEGRIALRHFDRTETKIKASYTTETNQTPKECKILDLSLSGLAFVCDEELRQKTRIRFTLPNINKNYNVKEFTVGGEIVRTKVLKGKLFDYGIKFFHIFKKDEELLKLLIEKYK